MFEQIHWVLPLWGLCLCKDSFPKSLEKKFRIKQGPPVSSNETGGRLLFQTHQPPIHSNEKMFRILRGHLYSNEAETNCTFA